MLRRCTGLTSFGSKCKRSENCQWHKPRGNCSICFEEVSTKYPINCTHIFHEQCIVQWYQHSDMCPVCRSLQDTDKYIIFKRGVENIISERYADAIRSLEDDVRRLRRRLRTLE